MMGDYCSGCFESPVCINVDFCGKGAEFLVKFIFKILHDFGEVFISDE